MSREGRGPEFVTTGERLPPLCFFHRPPSSPAGESPSREDPERPPDMSWVWTRCDGAWHQTRPDQARLKSELRDTRGGSGDEAAEPVVARVAVRPGGRARELRAEERPDVHVAQFRALLLGQ